MVAVAAEGAGAETGADTGSACDEGLRERDGRGPVVVVALVMVAEPAGLV